MPTATNINQSNSEQQQHSKVSDTRCSHLSVLVPGTGYGYLRSQTASILVHTMLLYILLGTRSIPLVNTFNLKTSDSHSRMTRAIKAGFEFRARYRGPKAQSLTILDIRNTRYVAIDYPLVYISSRLGTRASAHQPRDEGQRRTNCVLFPLQAGRGS